MLHSPLLQNTFKLFHHSFRSTEQSLVAAELWDKESRCCLLEEPLGERWCTKTAPGLNSLPSNKSWKLKKYWTQENLKEEVRNSTARLRNHAIIKGVFTQHQPEWQYGVRPPFQDIVLAGVEGAVNDREAWIPKGLRPASKDFSAKSRPPSEIHESSVTIPESFDSCPPEELALAASS